MPSKKMNPGSIRRAPGDLEAGALCSASKYSLHECCWTTTVLIMRIRDHTMINLWRIMALDILQHLSERSRTNCAQFFASTENKINRIFTFWMSQFFSYVICVILMKFGGEKKWEQVKIRSIPFRGHIRQTELQGQIYKISSVHRCTRRFLI